MEYAPGMVNMTFTETVTFEIFRLVALSLVYILFAMNLWSIRVTYRQFRNWAEDEAARRERWTEDMAEIKRQREEAYHLRAQAEVALAQARRHLPETRPKSNFNGAVSDRSSEQF